MVKGWARSQVRSVRSYIDAGSILYNELEYMYLHPDACLLSLDYTVSLVPTLHSFCILHLGKGCCMNVSILDFGGSVYVHGHWCSILLLASLEKQPLAIQSGNNINKDTVSQPPNWNCITYLPTLPPWARVSTQGQCLGGGRVRLCPDYCGCLYSTSDCFSRGGNNCIRIYIGLQTSPHQCMELSDK